MARKSVGRPAHKDVLTPAEWKIAHAVRHGLGPADIARRQGVSRDAVKFHIGNILGKLGLPDRQALRDWAGWPNTSTLRSGEDDVANSEISGIAQISRSVSDIEQAEAWYRDVLGLRQLFTFGQMAFFDCGSTRLMLSAEKADPPHVSIIYFEVGDIHAAKKRLEARGVSFISAPHMIHRHEDGAEEWMGFFNDPDGHPLALRALMSQRDS